MVWGIMILWAVGVIAIFVIVFRGLFPRHPMRAFLLFLSYLIVLIASFFLQDSFLSNYPGFRAFFEAAARMGPGISIVAGIVMALDIAAMVTYTIREGKTESPKGAVISDGPMTMGLDVPVGRSKRKMLVSKNKFITVEKLVDGTATFGERMIVVGIFILFIAFFFVFVGLGLMMLKESMVLFFVFPSIPGLFVYTRLIGPVWKEYREVKARLPH